MCVNTHITQTDKPRRPGHLAQEVVPSLHPVHSRPVRSWETKSEWILWSSYCYIQPLHQTEIYRNHDFSERTHSIIIFATCTRNRDNSDGDQVRVGLHTSLDSNNLKRWKVLLETSRLIFSFFYSFFFFFHPCPHPIMFQCKISYFGKHGDIPQSEMAYSKHCYLHPLLLCKIYRVWFRVSIVI